LFENIKDNTGFSVSNPGAAVDFFRNDLAKVSIGRDYALAIKSCGPEIEWTSLTSSSSIEVVASR
jgi:hypothetical protein